MNTPPKDPWPIAEQARPGKGDAAKYEDFARSLFADLVANGTPCRIVAYHWKRNVLPVRLSEGDAVEGGNMLVLCRRPSGGFLAKDSTMAKPAPIPRGFADDMGRVVSYFEEMDRDTSAVRVLPDADFNWPKG